MLDGLKEKEEKAIARLKMFQPRNGEPYWLCYSGGKDSDCIRILADLAGVPHIIEHNLTTVDAPETVRYIKTIKGAHINRPKHTMWELIVKNKMPPTRLARYCCEELKECGGKGRLKITGVRKSESVNRAKNGGLVQIIGKAKTVQEQADEIMDEYEVAPKGGLILNYDNDQARRMVEICYRTTSTMVNPIIDWEEADVWEFLHHYGCESNPLYKCGRSRIGCIGCPMKGPSGMKADFIRYPKYRQAYVHAFDRMMDARKKAGLESKHGWTDGESVFKWWTGDDPLQIGMEDGGDGNA